MANFLQKNKRKSLLAALLLFLKTNRTVTAALLLVVLASLMFISPSGLILHFPGGTRVAAGAAWVAGNLGMDTSSWGLAAGKRDFNDLLSAFRAAKEGGGKAGWAAFMRGQAEEAGKVAGGGSIDFVKGKAQDLQTAGGGGGSAKPGAMMGILTPDDAKNRAGEDGVALSDGDLHGERAGLVKSAFANDFGSRRSVARGDMLSGGAFANPGFFGGGNGSAASAKLADVVKGGVEDVKAQTVKGVPVKGGEKGRLNEAQASIIDRSTAKGLVGTHTISGQRAFVQLAAARGRAAISVAPNCTAGSGCPGEFAAVNTGVVYDGGSISGSRTDIIPLAKMGESATLNLPDTGLADDYIRQAEQMEADAKECREADDKYAPKELWYDQQQQALSAQFAGLNCGGGGCSKSKARQCMAWGNQMKQLCFDSMTYRCEHLSHCPLTRNNNCDPSACWGAPATNAVKITEDNGTTQENPGVASSTPIHTTTMDQGDDTTDAAVCTDAGLRVVQDRQNTQNAIDQYRSLDCVALGASTLIADRVRYGVRCAGPEAQVVTTCQSLVRDMCTTARACGSGDCPDESRCAIVNLSEIDDLVHLR